MNTLVLAAVAAATNAVVGAKAPVAELGAVVVEASRLGQTKMEIPSHVDVITKGEIDASGAASTVDLLEKRGNLFLRKLNGNPAYCQLKDHSPVEPRLARVVSAAQQPPRRRFLLVIYCAFLATGSLFGVESLARNGV